jgi:hypothetical protein
MATGKPKVSLPKKSIQPGPSALVAGVRVLPKAKSSKPRTVSNMPKSSPSKPRTMSEMPKRVSAPKPKADSARKPSSMINRFSRSTKSKGK